jgi:hypothetical protein
MGEIHSVGRVQCSLLEVDCGTHSLRALRRKLRWFELFLAEGLFAKTWRCDDIEVLVFPPREPRLRSMVIVAREVMDHERWAAYLYAT